MRQKISVEEIQKIVAQIRLENSENDLKRMPLEKEKEYYDKIREGRYKEISFMDFEKVQQVMGSSTKDVKKMFEYITVSAITLSARVAIEGGMDADAAFDLSDGMLRRLEAARGLEEMHDIIELTGAIMAYEVHKAKMAKGSYLTERIKNYIGVNIHNRIQLKDIADYLGMTPEYISSAFSRQEHCTIQEFIQKKKMEAAGNLLRFSEASIAEIAQYMGYQSQSNFSALFKKWQHLTPTEYRQQNKTPMFTSQGEKGKQ